MTTVTVMDYITIDEYREYIGSDTANKEVTIKLAISEASREIDFMCGRSFFQQDDTRYFSPDENNLWILQLDDSDLATTAGLTVHVEYGLDGTYPEVRTFGTDFICEPINQSVNGIGGWPFTSLRSVNAKIWPPHYADFQRDTVKIQGTWGWPAVPDPVKQAAKVLTAQRVFMANAPLGTAGVNGWGDVRVRDLPMVPQMLKPYTKTSSSYLLA